VTKGKVGAIRYTKCLSGKTYTKLKAITYVFYVRDGNGVGYSAPKSHRFTL
jgi:hypothetical protein